jgi:signal transduction histidine kinase
LTLRSGDTAEAEAQFLARVTRELASSLELEATLQRVARAALPALADWCVVDIVEEGASITRAAVAHVEADRQAAADKLARNRTPVATELSGVASVLRGGKPTLVDPEEQLLFAELGACSGIIAPMLCGERILGALSLGSARRYCEADLPLVEELASRCAQALHNASLYRAAREAIVVRDTFLATVSHDLKNPLATIHGQAQLLRRLRAPSDQPDSVERLQNGARRIEATVERMSRMIDGLLDITLVGLGRRLELEKARIDLVEVAGRVAAEHQERAPKHHIQLAGEPSLVGEWDLARIERVLDNLIGNAVKYSPDGGVITVICVKEGDTPDSWAILSVRDSGVGIPAADQGRIFERFQRAGNVGSISGTGLGLATIRDIVEQHGGTVTVDSTEGSGSTFTLRLPLHA